MTGRPGVAMDARLEMLVLKQPFHISGHVFRDAPVLVVELESQGATGSGEAAGVYFADETPDGILQQVEGVRAQIEAGLSRQDLRGLLPSGGARNAVDCALWELEANLAGCAVWQLAGLGPPRPLRTTMTIGAASPEKMADDARGFASAKAIKVKLTGDAALDIQRVRAVRTARPDVWLGVDANQGFTPATIAPLIGTLADCGVRLLEQPFARGREREMREIDFPMPTAGDRNAA